MNKEIYEKYPQFDFIGEIYMLGGKRYIRAEYKDECLREVTGNYYYCIEDGNFLLAEDYRDLVCEL